MSIVWNTESGIPSLNGSLLEKTVYTHCSVVFIIMKRQFVHTVVLIREGS